MKMREFKYLKPNAATAEPRRILTFNSSEKYVEGLDMDKLDKDEQAKVLAATAAFEKELEPFVKKGWRRFKTENIRD